MSKQNPRSAKDVLDEIFGQLLEAVAQAQSTRGGVRNLEDLLREAAMEEDESHASCDGCRMKKYRDSPMRLVQIVASTDKQGIYQYQVIVQDDVVVFVDEILHVPRVLAGSCENVLDLEELLNKDDGGLPVFLPGVAQHTKPGSSILEFGQSAGVHCYNTASGLAIQMVPEIRRVLGRTRTFKGLFNAVATINEDGSIHLARPMVIVH